MIAVRTRPFIDRSRRPELVWRSRPLDWAAPILLFFKKGRLRQTSPEPLV